MRRRQVIRSLRRLAITFLDLGPSFPDHAQIWYCEILSKRLSAFAFQISITPSSLKMRIMIGELRGIYLFCISATRRSGSGLLNLVLHLG